MISYNITGKSINLSIFGKNYVLPNNEEGKTIVEKTIKIVEKNIRDTSLSSDEKKKRILDSQSYLQAISDEIHNRSSLKTIGKQIIYDEKQDKYFYTWTLEDTPFISPVPIPLELVNIIKELDEKEVSSTPYLKFWVKLLRNPNIISYVVENRIYRAEVFARNVVNYILKTYLNQEVYQSLVQKGYNIAIAKEMSTFRQTPITQDGLIATYKVVEMTEHLSDKYLLKEDYTVGKVFNHQEFDKIVCSFTGAEKIVPKNQAALTFLPPVMGKGGDAFNCGQYGKLILEGHGIKVGQVISLDNWNQVDCSEVPCRKGLHVGNLDFVESYRGDNRYTLQTFVSPQHIGTVVESESVLRVKQYYAHSIINSQYDQPANILDFNYDSYVGKSWNEEEKQQVSKDMEDMLNVSVEKAERISLYLTSLN